MEPMSFDQQRFNNTQVKKPKKTQQLVQSLKFVSISRTATVYKEAMFLALLSYMCVQNSRPVQEYVRHVQWTSVFILAG